VEARRSAVPAHVVPWQHGRVVRWLAATDHKQVGILTVLTSLGFLLLAGVFSLLIRSQVTVANAHVLSRDSFNELVTMHGATLLYLVVLPIVLGLATYFTPLLIGAREMALPRVTALCFWLYLFAGVLIQATWLANGGPPKGTFQSLVPLAEGDFSKGQGQTIFGLALILLAVAWLLWAVNTLLTVVTRRAEGMTWCRLPLFAWSATISAVLLAIAAPVLGITTALLVLDREAGTHVFAGSGGARTYEHLFWFFGQPALGVTAILAAGVASEVIPVFSRTAIAPRRLLIGALAAMGLLSFLSYGRHLSTSGQATWAQDFFMVASLAFALAAAVVVIVWIVTLWGGRPRLTAALVFAIGFIVLFSAGVLASLFLAAFPVSWQLAGTAWETAQLCTLLVAALFGVFSALFYWWPKMFGRVLDERLGMLSFGLLFLGFLAAALPQFKLGLLGLEQDAFTYASHGWDGYQQASTAGVAALGLGVALLAVNVVRTLLTGKRVGRDPWLGDTLVWYAASPPVPNNFDRLPVIESDRPVHDVRRRLEAAGG
jgi:cytochrome c oxidase subunit 1